MARFSLLSLCVVHSLGLGFCLEQPGFLASLDWAWHGGAKRVFWPACKLEKTSGSEESGGEGGGSGRVGVHRSGGAHAGRGLSQAQPMGCCLPVKPSLLSGIESLSLPLDQTGGQLTSWW